MNAEIPAGPQPEPLQTFDEMIISIGMGDRIHRDERFGRFSSLAGPWRCDNKLDCPLQKDVPITFELEQEKKLFPDSMPKNILWIESNWMAIWDSATKVMDAIVKAQSIQRAEIFSLSHLWVFVPDAPVERAEWRLNIEPTDLIRSFNLVLIGPYVVRSDYA